MQVSSVGGKLNRWVRIETDGFQASVPAEQFKRLDKESEAKLGEDIIEAQRLIAVELVKFTELWGTKYRGLGKTPKARVLGSFLGCSQLPDITVRQIDRIMLSASGGRPGSARSLRSLLGKFRIKSEFILLVYRDCPEKHSGRVRQRYNNWRLAVNSLVERFYPAALKIYWEHKRRSTGRDDQAFSSAMSLLIKCAERYHPPQGTFAQLFSTYFKYEEIDAARCQRQDLVSSDESWEAILDRESGHSVPERQPEKNPEEVAELERDSLILHEAIRALPQVERIVIENSFDMGRYSTAQKVLAEDLKLTPGRLSQIKSKALRTIRRKLENEMQTKPIDYHCRDRGAF